MTAGAAVAGHLKLGKPGARGVVSSAPQPSAEASSRCRGLCGAGLVPAFGSFSIQYNYACASIAVAIMLSHNDEMGEGIDPDFPEPQWAQEFLLGIVFIGSVVGMLAMGYLGDLLGVPCALVVTNACIVAGALGSALLSWGSQQEVWGVIAACRFLLGVGVGGNYPLSAAKAAATPAAQLPSSSPHSPGGEAVGCKEEAAESFADAEAAAVAAAGGPSAEEGAREEDIAADEKAAITRCPKKAAASSEAARLAVDQAVARAAGAFFWQSPGQVTPYLVALLLLMLPHRRGVTSLQFRLLFALGALPALVVFTASLREARSGGAVADASSARRRGAVRAALRDRRHWRTLIGTAGTWFLFDIAFYGTALFVPDIVRMVFGSQQSLSKLAQRSALLATIGVLGVASGILVLPRLGAKALNTAGLALSGALFLVLMLFFKYHPEWHRSTFCIFCGLFYTLAGGPNVATYVLPVMAFPPEVRSTFHGLSSAAAKVGAMTGALLFPAVIEYWGMPGVMATQAAICAAGALLSHLCVHDPAEDEPMPTLRHVALPREDFAELSVGHGKLAKVSAGKIQAELSRSPIDVPEDDIELANVKPPRLVDSLGSRAGDSAGDGLVVVTGTAIEVETDQEQQPDEGPDLEVESGAVEKLSSNKARRKAQRKLERAKLLN